MKYFNASETIIKLSGTMHRECAIKRDTIRALNASIVLFYN
jgi:hypothetical protein